MYVHITQAVISYSKLTCDCNYHSLCVAHTSAKKTEYNKRIKTRSFWAPESESASTLKCMTPTLGTRPVSSVGLATNWRLSTVGNQTHPDWSFDRQRFLYGRLSICFSSCIFHSCIFHSRIFSAPEIAARRSAMHCVVLCNHSFFRFISLCLRHSTESVKACFWTVRPPRSFVRCPDGSCYHDISWTPWTV